MQNRDSSSTPNVKLRDGICFPYSSDKIVSADGSTTQHDINILSHAHGDHLVKNEGTVDMVTSQLTADLATARNDRLCINRVSDPHISLIPSGHIVGSRAALVDTPGGSILYTGDVSTRDRFYLDGFSPPQADVLIMEATYGKPKYNFPPTEQVIEESLGWLNNEMERPVILFGYTLGKAQKIQRLLACSERTQVFVTDAIMEMNETIEQSCSISFNGAPFSKNLKLGHGDAVVLPSQIKRFDWVDSLITRNNARTAGFSGWASDSEYIYMNGFDAGFILSDHCDFPELISIVESVSPERIYTHHGSSEILARELTRRGYSAQALQKDQTTLSDF